MEPRAAPAAAGTVSELVDGRLFALSNPYELDGRRSTHPLDVRGYAPLHCYLLKEGERALLVGTGLTVHEAQVLSQLEPLVGTARLSLLPLWYEFGGICNARPIADRFGIETIYQRVPYPPGAWLNFRPEFSDDGSDSLHRAAWQRTRAGDSIALDEPGLRELVFLEAPLRLLPTHWAYDDATRTLFTVDMFSWVSRTTADGPWVMTADDDAASADTVWHHLTRSRYWWLPGASTDGIRNALADVFDRYEIETIAPDYGCVLSGRQVVSRHYQLLDDALAQAPAQASIGIAAGSWTFREQTT